MSTDHKKEQLQKIRSLVSKIKIAALVTLTTEQSFKGRPMSTSEIDENGDIWFFTNAYTEKVEEILQNEAVFLTYSSPSDNTYVMVSGNAMLVDDKAKMESLWEPELKAWFPDGLKDPRMKLLKIVPAEVEYWSGDSGKFAVAFKILKAIVTGKEFKDDAHDKVILDETPGA